MADKWMEERERQWRERGGRGGYDYDDPIETYGEDRSFRADDDSFGEPGGYGGPETRRGPVRPGGGAYGADGGYGGYGRGAGGGRPGYRGTGPRITAQDYTRGDRPYGDDRRGPVPRDAYGESRRGGFYGASRQDAYSYGSARPAYGGPASGGTGGYDYERGYGDGGRGARRDERGPGDMLQRAGERVVSWFRGDDHLRDSGYRPEREQGHRGLGPKGYRRSDDRINDEVHERLTEDTWLDASNIAVQVSGGEVTLSGTVENREAKHRAERLVEDLHGVTHVQNNLRVVSNPLTGSGRGFGDSALEAQMRQQEDPVANGSGGAGGGQSAAGRKA